MSMSSVPSSSLWSDALAGNRDAFEDAIAPHQEVLLEAARRLVELQRSEGDLHPDDLTPEELVGETLLRAYETRARYDAGRMGMRAWLLGIQHRALARVIHDENAYAARKAVSLNAELPIDPSANAVEEGFWEFHQPDDVDTYSELVAGSMPEDITITEAGSDALTENEINLVADAQIDVRHGTLLVLHDEFDLSLSETAQILDASLKDTAETLGRARATLRAYVGSVNPPDAPEDATDSYTGDPIP